MADFRKWIIVLAVLALAVSASAQVGPLGCTASSGGVSTLVRSEGLAELVGDIVLVCTGTTTGAVSLNLQLFLNTQITSRNYDSASTAITGGTNTGTTEALLLLGNDVATGGEPGAGGTVTPALGANVFQGALGQGVLGSSLVWTNIPVTVGATGPSGTTRIIRITNVRANANGVPSSSIAGLPGTVQAFVSVTGTQTITLVNPQLTVAAVLAGLRDVRIRKPDNSDSFGTSTIAQCTGLNSSFAGDTTKTPGLTFQVQFRENFPSAWKPIGPLNTTSPNPTTGAWSPQVTPGLPYFTESGLTPLTFNNTGPSGLQPGQASQATRFFARFANVPPGVRIFVTNQEVNNAQGSTPRSAPSANLVGFDPTAIGNGQPAITIGTGLSVTTATSSEGFNLTEVPLTGGTGTAVWEVYNSRSASSDDFRFGVVVAVPANTTIAATPTPFATVSGGLAPVSTSTSASKTAGVPRFADTSSAQNVFNLALCVTNLLFPFVTNQQGFDTGIALVNTSLDNATGSSGTPKNQPFNTTPQHGTCSVYYFGNMASGGQLPAPQTTVDVAAGQMVAFAISQGGVPGATSSAAGFQGYIIARCNFQFAHGFAIVSAVGGGGQLASHGYLALIIPDTGETSRSAIAFDGAAGGEQLIQ